MQKQNKTLLIRISTVIDLWIDGKQLGRLAIIIGFGLSFFKYFHGITKPKKCA